MANCNECAFFFAINQDAGDYEPGKGDCVTEQRDEKGKFWLSKPVFETTHSCGSFKKSR
jgi:hypothetical protein